MRGTGGGFRVAPSDEQGWGLVGHLGWVRRRRRDGQNVNVSVIGDASSNRERGRRGDLGVTGLVPCDGFAKLLESRGTKDYRFHGF